MIAVPTIVQATVGQILPVRRFVGLLALAASPGVLVFLVTGRPDAEDSLDAFAGITVGLFFGVVLPIVTLILATSSLGDERRDSTLSFIVLKPIPRSMIALAKIIASLAASAAVLIPGAVLLGVARGVRNGEWEFILPLVISGVIGSAVYASLFTPLGYLTQRATLIGLAYVFLWEGAVSGAVTALATTSAWRIGFSAFAAMVPAEITELVGEFALGPVAPGVGGAIVKAVAVILVSSLLTTWILQARDLA